MQPGIIPYICHKCNSSYRNGDLLMNHLDNFCGESSLIKRVENMMASHENLLLHILISLNKFHKELTIKHVSKNNDKLSEFTSILETVRSISTMAGESTLLQVKIRLMVREMKHETKPKTPSEIKMENLLMKNNSSIKEMSKLESSIEKDKRNPLVLVKDNIKSFHACDKIKCYKNEPKTSNCNNISANDREESSVLITEISENRENNQKKANSHSYDDDIDFPKLTENIIDSDTMYDPNICDKKIRLHLVPELKWLIPMIPNLPAGVEIPKMAKYGLVPEKMFARKLKKLILENCTNVARKEKLSMARRTELRKEKKVERMKVENRTCSYCGKILSDPLRLRNHVNLIHLKDYSYWFCKECGQQFKTKENLHLHVKTVHNDKREKKFPCKVCGKKFYTNAIALKHESIVHGNGTRYPCKICGKVFKWKTGLEIHLQRIHENITYDCDICNEKLKTSTILYYHKRRFHDNIIDFKCDECDRIFNLPTRYKMHMKSKHGKIIKLTRKTRVVM